MNRCPCEECISFAICKIEVNAMKNPDVTQHSMARECEVLMQYIRIKNRKLNESAVIEARKLFGLDIMYE